MELIPPWVKDPRKFSLIINARGDTLNEKPSFRNAMKRRRCLFPADEFCQIWKPDGGRKRPYFIRPRHGGPVAFAGLWEVSGWAPMADGGRNRLHRHHGSPTAWSHLSHVACPP